jgi:hypothetical protein
MDKDEKGGFNYEAHEARAKALGEAGAGWKDEDFDEAVITGDLPPFWKPEEEGQKRVGVVMAVRKTKDFGSGPGEAIKLMGEHGLFALPIGAGLVDLDWAKQIGRTFLFVFKGWLELSPTTKMRKFVVRPKKGDGVPF